jgi:transporter family-2 protein
VPDGRSGALLIAVVAAGGLLGLQGRINGALGTDLHSAILAALLSFTVGTAVLAVVVAVAHRAGVRRLLRAQIRWWWWLGGFAGAAVVASTAAGVPEVGVALVSVCIVAGTAVGALAADEFGLGPGGRRAVTRARVGGALLAVAAVGLGAIGAQHAAAGSWLFVVLFAAGVASAGQQAANGQLRRAADSTAVASLVSFTAGTLLLLVAVLFRGDFAGVSWPHTWLMYVGGLLGAVYIALAAAAVQRLGVLRISLATVAGQLAGGVVLDIVWTVPGAHLRGTTIAGAVLTLVAVAVTGLGRRGSAGPVGAA